MKKLEDIVLKKGDIVYFIGRNGYVIGDNYDGHSVSEYEHFRNEYNYSKPPFKVTKIERPVKFETIYEAQHEILDKEEKEYMENVIRPFRKRVSSIKKEIHIGCNYEEQCVYKKECIHISMSEGDWMTLPSFKVGTMYKGMEVNKKYTLEELGLFE